MQKFVRKAVAVAALATLGVAQAGVINFDGPEIEGLPWSIFAGGESFAQAGFTLTTQDPYGNGLVGAITNSGSCVIADCPTGNASSFFVGLNDGGLSLVANDKPGFRFTGLDASFVAPVVLSAPGEEFGRLLLSGVSGGVTYQTSLLLPGQDADGRFRFTSFASELGAFGSLVFTELRISSCLVDSQLQCVALADSLVRNQSQFAIDNLQVTAVPEPGTWLLMALGLAGLGAIRRRQA